MECLSQPPALEMCSFRSSNVDDFFCLFFLPCLIFNRGKSLLNSQCNPHIQYDSTTCATIFNVLVAEIIDHINCNHVQCFELIGLLNSKESSSVLKFDLNLRDYT